MLIMTNKIEINKNLKKLLQSGKRFDSFRGGDGKLYWIKTHERFMLKHLIKGHPTRALKRELDGISLLKEINIPVPDVVYGDDRCIVTKDAGRNLQDIIYDTSVSDESKKNIFIAAGKMMANLHQQGYAHGGLALRDTCWDGSEITFLDLESFDGSIKSHRQISIDFYLFIHSWFRLFEKDRPELIAFIDAYKDNINGVQWQNFIHISIFHKILCRLCSFFKFHNTDMIAFTRSINFLSAFK